MQQGLDDAENNLGEAVDHIEDQFPLLADMVQGEAKQHRKQQREFR